MAGIGWLKEAVLLGWRNPKAIFGGAALFLLALLAVMALMLGVQMLVHASLDATSFTAIVLSLLPTLAMVAFLAVLMVGYLRLVDGVSGGAAIGAAGVFATLRDARGSGRAIGLMLVLMLLQYALVIGLMALMAPGFVSTYMAMLQMGSLGAIQQQEAASAMAADVWVMAAVLLPVTLFFYAVQAVGFGQVALRQGGVFAALIDGAAGAARNLLPLLVLVLVAGAGMVVLGLLFALLVAMFAFVAQMVGTWLQIALVVLAVPLYLGFMVALYGVSLTVMYLMWRDICGGRPASEFRSDALTA